MLADDPIGKKLCEEVDAHNEERRRTFVTGFARFVIARGSGARAPAREGETGESWQAVGRRLYGEALFNETLQRELAARKEQDHAKVRVPAVRGDQGEVPQGGGATGGSQDLGRKNHKQSRRKGPAAPAAST